MRSPSVLLLGWLLVGCVAGPGDVGRASGSQPSPCVDRDGDGFGSGCELGNDCDDADPEVQRRCLRCARPAADCPCEPGTQPEACFLDETIDEGGQVMCHEGTRHCRQGHWSECESIHSYALPYDTPVGSLIDTDAGVQSCSDCNVACFRITDRLDPVDGGLQADNSDRVDWLPGGGLSLAPRPDAGMPPPPAPTFDPSDCMPGTAPDLDCDGIPDEFDPYPLDKPFATANPAIFLDLAAGETGTGVIDLEFFMSSADIYFLLDQSGSMAGERDQLKADLVMGEFIDPSFDCADYDFDFMPNNELKTRGIIGAIRCLIRDANFGTGYFREVPLSGYAPSVQVAFENLQDVTADVDLVTGAVGRLTTIGNYDWPEAGMLALHSLATGDGMYFGIDRPGVAQRTDCPDGSWGYPCFREGAIPIIVFFTDAPQHNGPPDDALAYTGVTIHAAPNATHVAVPPSNQDWASAYDAGDVTASVVTLASDTSGGSADLRGDHFACAGGPLPDGADAVYSFSLSQPREVTISSEGSSFDTVVSLFAGAPLDPMPVAVDAGNESSGSAHVRGELTGLYPVALGSTAAMAADYLGSDLGCGAQAASPDAAFRFDVAAPTRVSIDSAGTGFSAVVALYDRAPGAPLHETLGAGADDFGDAHDLHVLSGVARAVSASTAGLSADFSAVQLGCGGDDDAPDAVHRFSLSQPARVRLTTEGSALDARVALHAGAPALQEVLSVPGDNEAQASAFSVGNARGRIVQLLGSSATMGASYPDAILGCGMPATGSDAVFHFSLDAAADVHIDSGASGFDHVLALHDGAIQPVQDAATDNTNETTGLAQALGTLDGAVVQVSAGDTTGMAGDYDPGQVSCAPDGAAAPDAVFTFHLDTATRVRLDTLGSSFDTVLSLHDGALPDQLNQQLASNENEDAATAYDAITALDGTRQRYRGNTSGMSADVLLDDGAGCMADPARPDAVFRFNVQQTGTYELSTHGTSFDTVLGLFPDTIAVPGVADPPIDIGAQGETLASAVDVGVLDGGWRIYDGDTSSLNDDVSNFGCGAGRRSPDAYFRFSLSTARTVTLSTAGSSFDTVLGLFRDDDSLVACDNDGLSPASRITENLPAGDYYVIVKGDRNRDDGPYRLSLEDVAVEASNLIACDDDGGAGFASRIERVLTPGDYLVVVKGKGAADAGSYHLRAADLAHSQDAHLVACNDDADGGPHSRIEADLTAGDYYVVVKGARGGEQGRYSLRLEDVGNPPARAPLACAAASGGQSAQLDASLPAGDYWLVLKGASAGGDYRLHIEDTASSAGAVLACDAGGMLEQDLPAGDYHVIVKGNSGGAGDAYTLTARDLSLQPITPLACGSSLEQDLAPGSYTVLLKGTDVGAAGDYSLAIRDATRVPVGPIACDDDSGRGDDALIRQTLDAGTYHVALKGRDANEHGPYQLSIAGTPITSEPPVLPDWYQTRQALIDRGIRVMTILSCHDDPAHGDGSGDCEQARAQATALANATDALGADLSPLVFDIDGDGGGLSTSVVDAIGDLTEYLEMDVRARVVFDPDANPGFGVTVRAIDEPGDGCDGLIGDEHQRCRPGSTPRFHIEIDNPLDAPVPLNPDDPHGGYNFRAELIGDGQFIVDAVPIYVIPQDVDGQTMGPPSPNVEREGSYWQDVGSDGCGNNQRPDWRDLSWSASVYPNTSVRFSACTAAAPDGLDGCVPQELATVTGGVACASDADCMHGFCDASVGYCQHVTGSACTDSSQCPGNASCVANRCAFESLPVYVGGQLSTGNLQPLLRMQIDLSAQDPFEAPPSVYGWELTYLCTHVE